MEINGGDEREECRRSSRLIEKDKKVNGGDRRYRDGRKGGDRRCGDGRKGGDRRCRN